MSKATDFFKTLSEEEKNELLKEMGIKPKDYLSPAEIEKDIKAWAEKNKTIKDEK